MNKFFILLVSTLFFLGCSSLRVSNDYDPGFNFSEQKTFAVVHHSREGEDTLLNDRIQKAMEADISSKGYIKMQKEEADLVFVFHTTAESKTDIDTDYQMIGYGRYAYGGGMVATTRTYHYTKGTLIIDALNPKDEKIVWRGIGTDTLREKKTPQKRTEYVNEVVKEIMKSFPSKLDSK